MEGEGREGGRVGGRDGRRDGRREEGGREGGREGEGKGEYLRSVDCDRKSLDSRYYTFHDGWTVNALNSYQP